MRLARLGETGAEIPVLQADGTTFDLRALTADIDGAFLSAAGLERVRDAYDAGSLPDP